MSWSLFCTWMYEYVWVYKKVFLVSVCWALCCGIWVVIWWSLHDAEGAFKLEGHHRELRVEACSCSIVSLIAAEGRGREEDVAVLGNWVWDSKGARAGSLWSVMMIGVMVMMVWVWGHLHVYLWGEREAQSVVVHGFHLSSLFLSHLYENENENEILTRPKSKNSFMSYKIFIHSWVLVVTSPRNPMLYKSKTEIQNIRKQHAAYTVYTS